MQLEEEKKEETKPDSISSATLTPEEVRDFIEGNPGVTEDVRKKILESFSAQTAKKDDSNKTTQVKEDDLSKEDIKNLNIKFETSNSDGGVIVNPDEDVRYRHTREFLEEISSDYEKRQTDPFLKKIKNITVTEEEKEKYIRAVDADEEFNLKIKLNKRSGFETTIKVKTSYEVDFLERYVAEIAQQINYGSSIETIKKLIVKASLAIQVKDFKYKNDISKKLITEDTTYEEFSEIVSSRIKEFSKLSALKYIMYINAIRIFDEKFAQLSEMYLNEDF